MKEVYLDYNAATPIHKNVAYFLTNLMKTEYGNPEALHKRSERIEQIIEKSRSQVAKAINANPSQIFFFNSASEANDFFHQQYIKSTVWNTSHDSMYEHTSEIIDSRILSIELVNNETGDCTVNVFSEANERYEQAKLVHFDAAQALGKIDVDVHRLWKCDFLTVSSPKIYGPTGAAALYVKNPRNLKWPKHQATPNWLSIAGFGRACELIPFLLEDQKRLKNLKWKMIDFFEKEIPDSELNSSVPGSVNNTLNIYLPNVEGEGLVMRCSARGIYFTTGSACASQSIKPSRTIMYKFNNDAERAHCSIRLSMGLETTEEDIDYALQVILEEYNKLKEFSTSNYRR